MEGRSGFCYRPQGSDYSIPARPESASWPHRCAPGWDHGLPHHWGCSCTQQWIMMESFLPKATLQGLLSGVNVFLLSKDTEALRESPPPCSPRPSWDINSQGCIFSRKHPTLVALTNPYQYMAFLVTDDTGTAEEGFPTAATPWSPVCSSDRVKEAGALAAAFSHLLHWKHLPLLGTFHARQRRDFEWRLPYWSHRKDFSLVFSFWGQLTLLTQMGCSSCELPGAKKVLLLLAGLSEHLESIGSQLGLMSSTQASSLYSCWGATLVEGLKSQWEWECKVVQGTTW